MTFSLLKSPVYVAGHNGLIGSALMRRLEKENVKNLAYLDREDLDLTNTDQVEQFFQTVRPQTVFLAAGRVGGILENWG